MHRLLPVVVLGAALLGAANDLPGQQAEPLQKSDIVRLLTGTTYTKAEVAGIIRQSCLSFTPTVRDRADFRALGADAAILSAIDACVEGPAPAPAAAIQLSMDRRIFDAVVGDTVRIPFTVTRSGAGEEGLRLRLEGSSAIRGGTGFDASAVTDASGRAVFVLPVGTAVGNINMSVEGSVALGGRTAVTVRVRAGPPAQAVGVPDPLPLGTEGEAVSLRVEVSDRFGNAVAGAPVSVRIGTETGTELFAGATSESGSIEGSVSSSDLGGENRLVLVSGAAVLGFTGVAYPTPPVAALTAVSGEDQRADAGQVLPAPLVIQATDGTGMPATDVEVRLTADNGSVEPAIARTDDGGRVEAFVTVGASGTETTVTIEAGQMSRSFTFPISVGGLTAAEISASLAEAGALLAAGDPAGARRLFSQVATADPTNHAAVVGVAESYSREGRYDEAIDRYQEILRGTPSRREAQVGLARALLGAGNPADAARWFEVALSQNRNDASALVGLGDARRRQGQADAARTAYEAALVADPQNERALSGLRRLSDQPSIVEGDIWGGYTGDNGRDPGFRWAEVRVYPAGGFELYGGYDDALNFRHPYLVRGRDDIRTAYGGLSYRYGSDRAYRTVFEFGRRKEPSGGTIQTTYTLDQTLRLGADSWFKIGGWLGHWFDRDDWVAFAEAGIAAGSVIIRPVASYGDYFGSGLTEVPAGVPSRAPAKEARFGLYLRYDPRSGLGVEPGVAYGNVESEVSEELSGALWDATLRAWYGFGHGLAVDGFFQYQAPPGLPSFWRVGVGFRFGIPRSG